MSGEGNNSLTVSDQPQMNNDHGFLLDSTLQNLLSDDFQFVHGDLYDNQFPSSVSHALNYDTAQNFSSFVIQDSSSQYQEQQGTTLQKTSCSTIPSISFHTSPSREFTQKPINDHIQGFDTSLQINDSSLSEPVTAFQISRSEEESVQGTTQPVLCSETVSCSHPSVQSPISQPVPSSMDNYSLWKQEALSTLTSHPMFNDLQKELHNECTNHTLPISLIQTTQESNKHSLPIVVRQRMLQLRFMTVKTKQRTKSVELQNFFNIQASKIESERKSELTQKTNMQWLHEGLNFYFDCQHHSLIDRIEQSLNLLEDITTPNKLKIPTVNVPIENNSVKKKNNTPRDGKHRFVSSYNPLAVRVMSNWYDRNKDHPYPSNDTCEIFAKTGNISVDQVKKWFANRRTRERNTKSLGQIAKERRTRKRTHSSESVLIQDTKRHCQE